MRKSTSDSERKLRKVRTEVAGRSPRRVFAAYAGVVALLLMGVVPAASAAEDPGSSEGDPPSSGTSSGDAGGLLAGLSSDPQLSVASTSAPDQPQSGASAPAAQAAVTPQPLVAPAPQSEQKSVEPATDQAESGGTQVDPPGGTDPPEDASQQSNDDEQIDDEPQSGGLTEAPASQRLAIAPLTTGPPLSCAVGAVYGISAGGQLQYVTSSGVTNIGTAAGATEFNGLGIAAGGTIAYGYERTSNNETIALYTFAPSTGTWTSTGATYASGAQGNPTTGFIGGAVDLATGTYYAGGYDGTRFNIFRYNAGSNTISFVGFITVDAASASNGDMAFDAAGNLFIVRGYGGQVAVYSVTRANLLAATGSTTVALDTASSRSFGAMNNVNGVAFGSDGKAFLGNADTVRGYDMPTWTNGTNLSTSVSSTDLASCTSPPTVTIQKNIVARDTPSDQFKLTLSQGQTVAGEATTAGDQVGVQTEIVGPIPVSWGSQLTFSETLVSGNIGDKYTSTWACTGGVTSSGSGTSGTLTVPSSGSAGTVCTFTNTPKTPSWSLVKSSSPASGSVVVPGQVITYSVVATNTSLVTLPAQTVTDNLSNVLNNADFVAGSINLPSEASLSGNTLTWNVPSLAAGATKTLTYQVKVKDTATNVTLKNAVTTTGGTPLDPCPQNNPKCRETEHKTPSWSLVKSADPVSGSTVVPGQEITYTLTVNNTSSVALPAQKVVDNLSDVLNNATFVAGSINPAAQASLDGTTLRWNVPAVAAGGSASVSYKVTVNADAKGVTLRNVATNDGGIPLDPCPQGQPNCRQTEHSTPDWSLEKLSNPASGSTVTPGSTITYTLRVTNDTGTAVTGVTVSDNLSSVVDNAALDVAGLPAGVTYDATSKTLTWTVGTLAANSVQSVDYKVTVNADAYGVTLKNVATGDGAVPPSTCASGSEECSTTHNTDPAWTLAKTSDPASGSKVSPGDTITYTLKVTSLSKDKAVTGVTVTDNLLSVVAYADLDEDGLPAGVTYDSATKTLTWAVGSLAAGQTKSIDYQVTVNADAYGVTLKNLATGSGSVPPQTCPTGSQSCSTTHDTDPAWSLVKAADPVSGSTVDSGSDITYTVTATSHSKVKTITDLVVEDDLSGVLGHATLDESSLPAGATYDAATQTLTWNVGSLLPGQVKSISYKVTVDEGAFGVALINVVTPGAEVPPPLPCVEGEPDCRTTEHYTDPEWSLLKSSDPVSGSTVSPGDTVTYTLTATNLSLENALEGYVAVDDLSDVVNNAVLDEDGLPAGVTYDAASQTLTWAVPTLEAGASAQVSYTVTVNDNAIGVTLKNVVTEGGETPPPVDCPAEDPDCRTTEHHTPDLSVDKTVLDAVQHEDGTWTVRYNVTVTNVAGVATTYSLTDTLQFGAGITVDSATWDGHTSGTFVGSSGALAVDEAIAAGDTTHVYTVTANATVAPGAWSDGEAQLSCPTPESQDGGGFLNKALLTFPGSEDEAEACTEPGLPSVSKAFDSATQSDEDPTQWLVVYTLTVTGDNQWATYYDLKDVPGFAEGATPVSGTWQRTDTDPAGPVTDLGAGGSIVSGAEIAAGATHTYRVIWKVDISNGIDPTVEECVVPGQAGKGFFNEAVLTSGGHDQTDDACGPIDTVVRPGVEKTVTGVAQNDDGSWDVTYDVVVTLPTGEEVNPKGLSAKYDLVDTLDFGSDITVESATWSGGPSGVVDEPFVEGSAQMASETVISPEDAVHTYTVTVNANVGNEAFDSGSAYCEVESEVGSGFLNRVTLTSAGTPTEDQACAEPAAPNAVKTGQESVQNDDGTWSVSYLVQVTNDSDQDLVYSLTDTPAPLPERLTFVGDSTWMAEALQELPEGTVLVPQKPAEGDWEFAKGRIPAGETLEFLVTAELEFEVLEVEPGEPCEPDGQVVTLPNQLSLTSGWFELESHSSVDVKEPGCVRAPGSPTWTLEKSSDPASGSSVKAGGSVTYTLTVVNTGEVEVLDAIVRDDLSDVLKHATLSGDLAAGLSVDGSTLTWAVPDVEVGQKASVSYTVTVKKGTANVQFKNVAIPDSPGGECLPGKCSTTHIVPPTPTPPGPLALPRTGATVGSILLGGLMLGAIGYGLKRRSRMGA